MTGMFRLSENAQAVFRLIGHGYTLRVPHGSPSDSELVIPPLRSSHGVFPSLILSETERKPHPFTVLEIIRCPLLHKLSADGEPPPSERKRNEGWRLGWHELGFTDGDVADYYVCTQ